MTLVSTLSKKMYIVKRVRSLRSNISSPLGAYVVCEREGDVNFNSSFH